MRCRNILMLALCLGMSCKKTASVPHVHADEHPQGHDHHAVGHGHTHGLVRGFTLWSKDYELFGELRQDGGEKSELLLHLTELKTFSALTGKRVDIEYNSDAGFKRVPLAETQPGIFLASLPIAQGAVLQAKVLVQGRVIWWPREDSDLITVGVSGQSLHDHAHAGQEHPQDEHPGPHEDHHDHGEIELLKEQQWNIPFATAEVRVASLEPTKEVLGHVEFPPNSTAQVSATMAGKIMQPLGGFPHPGQEVKAGQVLARIAPTVQSADQLSKLNLAVVRARSTLDGAASEFARQQRLAKQNATSRRALEQAQRDHTQAKEALKAAEASQRIYKRGSRNALAVRSPIAGILTAINVRIGELAATGQVMFRVSNTQSTWLRVHIPVQWMGELHKRGAISVFDDAQRKWKRFSVSSSEGQAPDAALLNVAVQADLNAQVVDVLYAIYSTRTRWLVGASKRILVPVGQPQRGWVIPRSAIVHHRGEDSVYVQVDGEHFVPRKVKIQLQQGDNVLVKSGLHAGERVVTKSASIVALAAKKDVPMGHGHLH